jgi:DNA invertase Pin-like site-specific DNA recombinase
MIRKAETKLTPAAVYIRHSSGKQEKSPAEQRVEIDKLAARHDCQIVKRYDDAAVTGDSHSSERPGLADLLAGAKAGAFKTVLIWHTNRLTREDPMDGIALYNVLRKAGVGLISCCEGSIDLDDFAKQLLLFIGQKGNHDYLTELSAKVLRGKLANAKEGRWNGGRANYGMERALFDPEGRLVCRLKPGEYMTRPGHTVKLVPTSDPTKREAVCYAFQRFDEADLSLWALAKEMHAKGFPAPRAGGWHDRSVYNILTTRAYVGTARWNHNPGGKYNQVRAGELVSVNGSELPAVALPDDAVEVADAHEGFIPRDQFDRVQRKLASQKRRHASGARVEYPLTGLLVCAHCGKPMQGHGSTDHRGGKTYVYKQYNCSTYLKYGNDHGRNTTCLSHTIDARQVLDWLVFKLQETVLGPRRAKLVQQVKADLTAAARANSGDLERLDKRAGDLDREVGRLVKAIRTIDAAELVEELSIVRAERDRVKAELTQARKMSAPADLDSEAERLADTLAELGETLNHAEPAVLREVLRQFVSRIVCEWEPYQTKGGKPRRRFKRGTVELWAIPGYDCFDYCEDRLDDGVAGPVGR